MNLSMYMYSYAPASPKQQAAMEDMTLYAKHPLEKV